MEIRNKQKTTNPMGEEMNTCEEETFEEAITIIAEELIKIRKTLEKIEKDGIYTYKG